MMINGRDRGPFPEDHLERDDRLAFERLIDAIVFGAAIRHQAKRHQERGLARREEYARFVRGFAGDVEQLANDIERGWR